MGMQSRHNDRSYSSITIPGSVFGVSPALYNLLDRDLVHSQLARKKKNKHESLRGCVPKMSQKKSHINEENGDHGDKPMGAWGTIFSDKAMLALAVHGYAMSNPRLKNL